MTEDLKQENNYGYFGLRQYLEQHLEHLTPLHWVQVCELYSISLDIIREYRDYIEWQVFYDYSIFDKLDYPKDALREFKEEMHWEEDAYKKWIDDLRLRGYKKYE